MENTANEPLVHLVTDDEVKGKAKEIFEQIKEKTGSVPKWMRVMANSEDVFVGFFSLFSATMDNAPLESTLKWKIAYKVSQMNKCEFCVDVSVMKLQSMGLSEEAIATLDEGLSEREQVAMKYAEASTEHAYAIDPVVLEETKKHFNDEELVELTSVVGLFNFINRFNDALGVLPEPKA